MYRKMLHKFFHCKQISVKGFCRTDEIEFLAIFFAKKEKVFIFEIKAMSYLLFFLNRNLVFYLGTVVGLATNHLGEIFQILFDILHFKIIGENSLFDYNFTKIFIEK